MILVVVCDLTSADFIVPMLSTMEALAAWIGFVEAAAIRSAYEELNAYVQQGLSGFECTLTSIAVQARKPRRPGN